MGVLYTVTYLAGFVVSVWTFEFLQTNFTNEVKPHIFDDYRQSRQAIWGGHYSNYFHEVTLIESSSGYAVRTEYGDISVEEDIDLSTCVGEKVDVQGWLRRRPFSEEARFVRLYHISLPLDEKNDHNKCYYWRDRDISYRIHTDNFLYPKQHPEANFSFQRSDGIEVVP